jgi:SNF2 family DNA or RNA helicase
MLVDGIPYRTDYTKQQLQQLRKQAKVDGKGIPYRLFLTGTPVMNRPNELIAQLTAMGRLDDLGGFWHFANRYCGYEPGRGMMGAHNLAELNDLLRQTCFIRRLKADVLKELPAKTSALVPMAIDNEDDYRYAESDLIGWLHEQGDFEGADAATRAEHLVRIERLKQLAADGKMGAVCEWIDSFLESGEKLVVFAHHVHIVNALADRYSAPRISGAVSEKERDAAIQAFQNDPQTRLIVCNIQAGGVGITLTAASNVAFVELAWTPAAHEQAVDRTHRIGQRDVVIAWYLLANGTIDDDIYALIESKRVVVNAATDGGTAGEASILKELTTAMLKKQGQGKETK